jgi:putative phosphoribosyl transferase
MEARQQRTFRNRAQAGKALADAVARRKPVPPLLVLALPRGGVPVAFEVARRLDAPLDVLVVRKIGMPGQPELAIGAIAAGGVMVRNDMLPRHLVNEEAFGRLASREMAELQRREEVYRAGQAPLQLRGAHVVLVDDGLATGSTMRAAVAAVRKSGAHLVMVAAPVASMEAQAMVAEVADECVFLIVPPWLGAVGEFYEQFDQVTDAEVTGLLAGIRTTTGAPSD